jgi:hypothetical protein
MHLVIISLCLLVSSVHAQMSHRNQAQGVWEVDGLEPFNEWMLTWNTARPLDKDYQFYVSVKTDEWSPWLPYAIWGANGQSSHNVQSPDGKVKVFQDTLEIMNGKATGFRFYVNPSSERISLHAYTNGDLQSESPKELASVILPVDGLSQIALDHPRARHLCSPTSTTAVVRFLLGQQEIDPILFAADVWDRGFDIYGNWVFNAAEAATLLGPAYHVWVERLSGFEAIHQKLMTGTPVVVSIRGPLKGSALPYEQGHLVAVIGYDALERKVFCIDPAFPTDAETKVSYPLEDFLQAWNRRGRVAYCFLTAGGDQVPFKRDSSGQ